LLLWQREGGLDWRLKMMDKLHEKTLVSSFPNNGSCSGDYYMLVQFSV